MATALNRDQKLSVEIYETSNNGDVAETTLETDGRVLARITDGIYRQPGSALRELISNAFDADATRVVILTDRPRFASISIEDDGHGMKPETVVHLLHHIGSSAKRSKIGGGLGVTQMGDPLLSPGGRHLIGRVGIGMFSVAQLTQSFRIITKTKDDPFRTVAVVNLKQYTELPSATDDDTFEAGKVKVWREVAHDLDAHGTTIVLDSIRPKTRDSLRSLGAWKRYDKERVFSHRFHIGRHVDGTADQLLRVNGRLDGLPWDDASSPEVAFRSLVDAVWFEWITGDRNPKLESLFDEYLQMVWTLSLSVPLPYIDGHPFDLTFDETVCYQLPGPLPGQAEVLPNDRTVRQSLGIAPTTNEEADFRVLIDDLALSRPLKFDHLPTTTNAVKTPMLFVGGLREEFPDMDPDMSGGPLEFVAYLLWSPKVAPIEHAGCLVRVHGASGTLFDPSFMRYGVAETTRLKQISCEVFVTEGFEAALTIDREQFNLSHPHVVRLTSWLHSALTRAINAQKGVASRTRSTARREASNAHEARLNEIVDEVWANVAQSLDDVPSVELKDGPDRTAVTGDSYVFSRAKILQQAANGVSASSVRLERQIVAVIQLLSAYGVLDQLEPFEQETMIARISEILQVPS